KRSRRPLERLREIGQSRGFLLIVMAVIFVLLVITAHFQGTRPERLLSLLIWGVGLGGVIGLGSIGLTLVYGVLKFPNFSHGALVTLGAYFSYSVMALLPAGPAMRPLSFGWEFIVG